MTLAADSHVHSEWSWDTGGPASSAAGTMRRTCERAVRIGLPAVAFTEHLDLDDAWQAGPDDFPDLRIMTGVEWGQPHLFEQRARALLDLGSLDRVNGSLHTLPDGDHRAELLTLYKTWAADDVMSAYLEEVPRVVTGSDVFEVFTHLDYAVRHWPTGTAGPFDPLRFEEPMRVAMRAIADSGRALEMNTRRLQHWMPLWWREEGGTAVTLGSDSHVPETVGDAFPEAAALLEHVGFRRGRRPEDYWASAS